MSKGYYMVRVKNGNFDLLSRKSVVAIGWSDWDFSKLPEDSAVEEWERCGAENDIAPNVITRKSNEIRQFYNIKAGDRILVPHNDCVWLAIAGSERVYDKESKALDLSNQLRVSYLKINGVFCDVPIARLSEQLKKKLRLRGTAVTNLGDFSNEIEKIFRLLFAHPCCDAENIPPITVCC